MDSCSRCKYQDKREDEVPCVGCIHNAVENFKPMTQADRIRSMTDEELAEYLLEIARTKGENMYVCDTSGSNDMCLREETCEECMLAWLKSEVGCE